MKRSDLLSQVHEHVLAGDQSAVMQVLGGLDLQTGLHVHLEAITSLLKEQNDRIAELERRIAER